jgi:hypothetical protein
MIPRATVNQRGNITLYLLFSLAVSAAVGYGVYVLLRDSSRGVAHAADGDIAPARSAQAERRVEAPAPEEAAPPAPLDEGGDAADRAAVAPPPLDGSAEDTVVLGVPGVAGALEPAQIERTIKRYMVRWQRCMRRQQERAPLTARGDLRVELVIASDGSVVYTRSRSAVPEELARCVLDVVGKLRFDQPTDGGKVSVVYPMAFVPARDGSDPLAP